jgi:hypothetical protein
MGLSEWIEKMNDAAERSGRMDLPDEGPRRGKKRGVGGSHPTRSAAARWGGDEELFKEGFLSVPHRFLRHYASLEPPLTSGEALFVLQLMTFKWDEAAPFPSYDRIAKAMGVTHKMVRRYAQRLQRKGYLRREFQMRATNKFDLTGLFRALSKRSGMQPSEASNKLKKRMAAAG